jgi:ABC-type spermidine/putrescine transport system permease subunit II
MNTYDASRAMETQKDHAEKVKLAIQGAKGAADSFATSTVKAMQGVSSIATGISSLVGAFETLKNPDMSFGEKLLSVTMSLSMAIPALITGISALVAIDRVKMK